MKRLCIVTFLLEHLSLSINISSATFIKVKTAATMTSWQTGFQAKKRAPRSARFLFFFIPLHTSSIVHQNFTTNLSTSYPHSANLCLSVNKYSKATQTNTLQRKPSLREPLLVHQTYLHQTTFQSNPTARRHARQRFRRPWLCQGLACETIKLNSNLIHQIS